MLFQYATHLYCGDQSYHKNNISLFGTWFYKIFALMLMKYIKHEDQFINLVTSN